jgi:tetratricopeptide (TPR) repeat protein
MMQWSCDKPKSLIKGIVLFALLLMLGLSAAGCSNLSSQAQKADKAGDLKSAVALYRDRLKAEPDDLAALRGLAVDLYMMSAFDEALPVQEKIVALDAKDSQTRVELGFNYLNHQDDPVKAVAVLGEAAALEPAAKYLTFLAQAEIAAGEKQKAEETLRKALAADGNYGHAYTVLVGLLEGQRRLAEASELRDAAKSAGVTIEEGQGPS